MVGGGGRMASDGKSGEFRPRLVGHRWDGGWTEDWALLDNGTLMPLPCTSFSVYRYGTVDDCWWYVVESNEVLCEKDDTNEECGEAQSFGGLLIAETASFFSGVHGILVRCPLLSHVQAADNWWNHNDRSSLHQHEPAPRRTCTAAIFDVLCSFA
jgi:hypothetical protein